MGSALQRRAPVLERQVRCLVSALCPQLNLHRIRTLRIAFNKDQKTEIGLTDEIELNLSPDTVASVTQDGLTEAVLPPSGKVGLRSVTTKAFCISIDILFPGKQELKEIKILISARLRNTEKNEIFFNPGGRCCALNHVP